LYAVDKRRPGARRRCVSDPSPYEIKDLLEIVKKVSEQKGANALNEGQVRFWGVRGSIPVPDPRRAVWGQHPLCGELRQNGKIFFATAERHPSWDFQANQEFAGRPIEPRCS